MHKEMSKIVCIRIKSDYQIKGNTTSNKYIITYKYCLCFQSALILIANMTVNDCEIIPVFLALMKHKSKLILFEFSER